jgi:segregation and condensation protein B
VKEQSELKNIIEAALLAADRPLTVKALKSLFPNEGQPTSEQIGEVLDILEKDYDTRGIELRDIGKGYRFQSREKYAPWLRKLNEGRPPRYSRAALETLAIIAYRQPVTRGDIEEIRGVGVSTDIMRLLVDRGWVKEVGRRDVPGHPALFGTTREFLEYFSLGSLNELPMLKERREPAEVAKDLNLRLPLELTDGGNEAQMDMEQSEIQPDVQHSAEIIHLDTAGKPHSEHESDSEPDFDADGGREVT